MKLLLVTPYYYPKIGGLENYARQLAIALNRREGFEIVVVTSNHTGRQATIETLDSMKVYRLPFWFKFSNTPINPLWSFKLGQIIKSERPDVIHAHTPVPTMADAAALASGKTPFVLTYHAATLKKGGSVVFNFVATVYGLYEKLTFIKADRIFAVSDYVREQMTPKTQLKTVVVPNAIWADEIIERKQPTAANFIFIGSLDQSHSWKGLEATIRAIGEYRTRYNANIHLTVIGDGDARAYYEALVASLKLSDNIEFMGSKLGTEKDALLAQATGLIAYPISGNDAFPTVFLEAWAKYVPVISAAIGPIPSLIDHNETGYLVEPNDSIALATTLYVVMNDHARRTTVAVQAADLTRAKYTWEIQAATMAHELRQLI
jgi:glycosyltransferase involved in cell wall biosynthesis